jgi:Domain of unknown function (DUF4276)
MHLEVLVEEPSAKAALDRLLPKAMMDRHTFTVHAFTGKSNLLDNLLPRLRAYALRFQNDPETAGWRIVVLIDEDRQNCVELKQAILDAGRTAGIHQRILARVAVEELEAWYLGDLTAIRAAYPRVPATLNRRKGFRDPDSVAGGTWEALDRILKKSGYSGGLRKIAAAEAIAPHMDPGRNGSHSFRVFWQGVERLLGEAEVQR